MRNLLRRPSRRVSCRWGWFQCDHRARGCLGPIARWYRRLGERQTVVEKPAPSTHRSNHPSMHSKLLALLLRIPPRLSYPDCNRLHTRSIFIATAFPLPLPPSPRPLLVHASSPTRPSLSRTPTFCPSSQSTCSPATRCLSSGAGRICRSGCLGTATGPGEGMLAGGSADGRGEHGRRGADRREDVRQCLLLEQTDRDFTLNFILGHNWEGGMTMKARRPSHFLLLFYR